MLRPNVDKQLDFGENIERDTSRLYEWVADPKWRAFWPHLPMIISDRTQKMSSSKMSGGSLQVAKVDGVIAVSMTRHTTPKT